jgi:hypothetical protein
MQLVQKCAALGLVLAGCYAEVGGGYMPSVHEVATPLATGPTPPPSTTTSTGGWTVALNVGFYLDTPVPAPMRYFPPAIGGGLALIGENALVPGDHAPRSNTSGYEGRLDLTLPIDTGDLLSIRATGAYGWASKASFRPDGMADYSDTTGHGRSWFLGGTIGGRNDKGALFQLSLGVQHQHGTSVGHPVMNSDGLPGYDLSATGVALRFMIAWTPTGALMRGYQYEPPKEQTHHDCHPVTTTSSDGTTTTRTECY